MRVVEIAQGVYQFGTYFEPVRFTFNQYLVVGEQPLLVQAGPCFLLGSYCPRSKRFLEAVPSRMYLFPISKAMNAAGWRCFCSISLRRNRSAFR